MTASPTWSPDGQRIAFIGDQNGKPGVWMISANGGPEVQLRISRITVHVTERFPSPVSVELLPNVL
jgi:Tol biopolymer transport system component